MKWQDAIAAAVRELRSPVLNFPDLQLNYNLASRTSGKARVAFRNSAHQEGARHQRRLLAGYRRGFVAEPEPGLFLSTPRTEQSQRRARPQICGRLVGKVTAERGSIHMDTYRGCHSDR